MHAVGEHCQRQGYEQTRDKKALHTGICLLLSLEVMCLLLSPKLKILSNQWHGPVRPPRRALVMSSLNGLLHTHKTYLFRVSPARVVPELPPRFGRVLCFVTLVVERMM